jgi:hypothetical protein
MTQGLSAEDRRARLQAVIQAEIVRGARVESQTDTLVVIVHGRRVNHLLHFLIGVFTIGMWWFVWLLLAILGGEKRYLIAVDEQDNVSTRRAR